MKMSKTVMAMIVVVALSGVAALMEMRARHEMATPRTHGPSVPSVEAPAMPVPAPIAPLAPSGMPVLIG